MAKKKKISFLRTFWELNKPMEEKPLLEEKSAKEKTSDDMLKIGTYLMAAFIAQAIAYFMTNNMIYSIIAGLIGGTLSLVFYRQTPKKKEEDSDERE